MEVPLELPQRDHLIPQLLEAVIHESAPSQWTEAIGTHVLNLVSTGLWDLTLTRPRSQLSGVNIETPTVNWIVLASPLFSLGLATNLIRTISPPYLFNVPDAGGYTPLSLLMSRHATTNAPALVDELLSAGASPVGRVVAASYTAGVHGTQTVRHSTASTIPPLHAATESAYGPNSIAIVNKLIKAGAFWEERDGKSRTALSIALAGDDMAWVDALVKNYPTAFQHKLHNLLPFFNSRTLSIDDESWKRKLDLLSRLAPLAPGQFSTLVVDLITCAESRLDSRIAAVFEILATQKSHIVVNTEHLFTLARTRCVKTVEVLILKWGLDVNARNSFTETPLHAAAAVGDPDMIRLLLRYGADPDLATLTAPNHKPFSTAAFAGMEKTAAVLGSSSHSVLLQASVNQPSLAGLAIHAVLPDVSDGVVQHVACGTNHSVIVTTKGTVFTRKAALLEPVRVRALHKVCAGSDWSAGLDSRGAVWIWGRFVSHGLALHAPQVEWQFKTRIVDLAAVGQTMVALDEEGSLFGFGREPEQARIFRQASKTTPVTPMNLDESRSFSHFALSRALLAALTQESDELIIWDGTSATAPPVIISTSAMRHGEDSSPKKIVAGSFFVAMLWTDGSLWTIRRSGRIREVTCPDDQAPFAQVSAVDNNIFALTSDGIILKGEVQSDGKLSLTIKLPSPLKSTPEAGIYGPRKLVNMVSGPSGTIAWTGGPSPLSRALSQVRESVVAMEEDKLPPLADLQLTSSVEEGVHAWVHQSILKLRAPVFMAALLSKAPVKVTPGGTASVTLPIGKLALRSLVMALYSDHEIPSAVFDPQAASLPASLTPLRVLLGVRAVSDLTGSLQQDVQDFADRLYKDAVVDGAHGSAESPLSGRSSPSRLKDWFVGRMRSNSISQYETSTDFELKGHQCSLKVHRVVLAARSSVFSRLVEGPWCESQNRSVVLCDDEENPLPAPVVARVVHWMYTGLLPMGGSSHSTPSVGFDEAMAILHVADMYDLAELKSGLETVICDRLLSPAHAAVAWAWSKLLELPNLQSHAEHVIRISSEAVQASDGFKLLPSDQQDLLRSGLYAPIPPPPPLPPPAVGRKPVRVAS